MATNNMVFVIGRLTKDPELKKTENGNSVVNFSIGVDRPAKAGEEKICDFLDVTAWGTTAEFVCRYFKKGSAIIVKGSLQKRAYEDKEGNKRSATDIKAEEVGFCPSSPAVNSTNNNATTKSASEPNSDKRKFKKAKEEANFVIENEDDLPF